MTYTNRQPKKSLHYQLRPVVADVVAAIVIATVAVIVEITNTAVVADVADAINIWNSIMGNGKLSV